MKIITQLGIVFVICIISEVISGILPISFPASVIGMIILFLLLLFRIIKPNQIETVINFLLQNMAFFFIPAGVSIMDNFDIIKNNIIQLLLICIITTILTFFTTAFTVKFAIKVQSKWNNKK